MRRRRTLSSVFDFVDAIELSLYAIYALALLAVASIWAYRTMAESHPLVAASAAITVGALVAASVVRDAARRRVGIATKVLIGIWAITTVGTVIADLVLSFNG